MQINVIADNTGGHYRVLLMRLRKLRKCLIALGVDHCPFFNPTDLVLLRLDFQKPSSVFQNFQLLSIHHLCHAIGNCGNAVMKVHLPGGHIHRVVLLVMELLASARQCNKTQHQQRRNKGPEAPEGWDERDGRLREHSQWRSS